MNDSDRQLIEAYFAGDEKSFESLVRRHLKSVYNFLARYTGGGDGDDLAQETFLRAWKHLGRFDLDRDFRIWLFSIARNVGIDWLRKNKKHSIISLDEEFDDDLSLADKIEDTAPAFQDVLDQTIEKESVRKIIDELPPAQNLVLVMRYENDMTFQDISAILGISVNTVKSRYRRALTDIKEKVRTMHRNKS